jgi:hypothetical protein
MTRELRVAQERIMDVSASSTKNVDCPARMRSEAPTRVKTRSTGVRRQLSAGTYAPICAMRTAVHAVRR